MDIFLLCTMADQLKNSNNLSYISFSSANSYP